MWRQPRQRRRGRSLVARLVEGLANPYAQCVALAGLYLAFVLAAPSLAAMGDAAWYDQDPTYAADAEYRIIAVSAAGEPVQDPVR